MGINIEAEKRAYQKFIAAGMTPEGACGMIGNLEAESDGFYTNRVEYLCLTRLRECGKIYTDATYTAAIDSGEISRAGFLNPLPDRQYGYGIAQWTSPERKAGLYDLAKKKRVSIADEDTQMEWLLQELQTVYAGVLSLLKKTRSIRNASDAVLKKFEIPDDTGEHMCAARAARGQKFYNEYVKKGESTMGVRMANCGHDENGNYHGGQAGDQSGTEWYLCNWYSYPWDYIIRWKNASLANLFAELAVEAANNNKIGYDQWQRDTFLINLEDSGWRPKDITVPCETDCSKGTIDLIKAVGHLKGIKELKEINATYTGNMLPWFQSAAGRKYFTVLTGKYLTNPSLARKGDINLNVQNHTNITVDNGTGSGTQTSAPAAKDPNAGKIGNCTVTLHTFLKGAQDNQIKAIQTILKRLGYKGKGGKELEIDGHLGENTAFALEQFQRDQGMKNINFGTVAATTWSLLLSAK